MWEILAIAKKIQEGFSYQIKNMSMVCSVCTVYLYAVQKVD